MNIHTFEFDVLPRIRNVASELNWRVDARAGILELAWISPEGKDFRAAIEVSDIDLLVDRLSRYVSNFDVSKEAYLWLDNSGHGKNGAPYDMRDVYNDIESCKISMSKLLDKFLELWREMSKERLQKEGIVVTHGPERNEE